MGMPTSESFAQARSGEAQTLTALLLEGSPSAIKPP